MNSAELKDYLDHKADLYENPRFLDSDPIQIPHHFSSKEDIEISAFLIATIAWGNRKSILKSGWKLIELMGHSPREFVDNYPSGSLLKSRYVHRTFNAEDLDFFIRGLQNMYLQGGLENAFSQHTDIPGIKGRIISFRQKILSIDYPSRTAKHLSNPMKNAASKRLNMFLRWMVRPATKGVDFGIWSSIGPHELYLPLDVHTGNIARELKLTMRKQDDWTTLEEIMTILRGFDADDPVKYDFALFGIGAFEKF